MEIGPYSRVKPLFLETTHTEHGGVHWTPLWTAAPKGPHSYYLYLQIKYRRVNNSLQPVYIGIILWDNGLGPCKDYSNKMLVSLVV